MTGQPDTLLVTAALWVAAASAAWIARGLFRTGRARRLLAAAVMAAACAGGVASAQSPHRHAQRAPSLAWGTADERGVRGTVVVRPGDCLWAITAHQLHDPTVAQIAAYWPDWWRANRVVIGPDPNLIHPGQRLRRPGSLPRRH